MSLAPGTRVGPFEIRSLLGVGGMGEVYRATDSKLGREVALKFLPEAVAADPARLGRFEREAQTLAALNHPNIAQIYGLQDNALVMELLDGSTLAARIAEGPLPIRKAIDYGVQMARGLAAAHARGIVHRDLKPDNVFVLPDGHVKIIDFGLARGAQAPSASDDSHTMTNAPVRTDPGTVMGTVGYMAPEQVRGDALDARADLFALGAVLFEVLSGERAFKRDTAPETMTAILRDDPRDLTTLRAEIPPALERIVRHCLEKNPVERFQTARDVAFALESLSTSSAASSQSLVNAAPLPAAKPSRERMAWLAACVLLAGVAAWLAFDRGARTPAATTGTDTVAFRTSVLLPDKSWLAPEVQPPLVLALSPDSQRIAFVRGGADGTNTIWEHSLATGEAHLVPGTAGGNGPAYGANGELLFSVSQQLRRVDQQGRVTTVPNIGYAEWVSPTELLGVVGAPGRWRVAAVRKPGGAPEELYPQVKDGEDFILDKMVPGQRLFVVQHRLAPGQASQIELASFDGGPPSVLTLGATTPYVAAGYLLFARADRLYAQPIDLAKRALTGTPTLLAEHLDYGTATGAAFAASDKAIVYAAVSNSGKGRLTLMSRAGATLGTVGDEADYSNVELSPDGTRAAVSVTTEAGRRDIYVVDLARGVRQRLTSDPTDERSAVFTRDGRSIIYNSKGLDLYRRPSDFSASESPVLVNQISKDPRDVSPDGKQILYRISGPAGNDLWVAPLNGEGAPHAVLDTKANENYGSFSPDGKSMVYVSDESGRFEVYVRSLAGGSTVQVSTTGGTFPRWRQAQEIVYLAPDRTLMRVPVTGTTFGTPTPLFKISFLDGPGTPFDITPDGQRFIVNATTPSAQAGSLQLIVNWTALLKNSTP